MVNLYSAFFFVTAISAIPLGRRDVTTVVNNLKTIDTQTNALTTSINSWDGSLLGALGIASASNTLGTAIDNANTAAATEAQFSSTDTQTVLTCKCHRPVSSISRGCPLIISCHFRISMKMFRADSPS